MQLSIFEQRNNSKINELISIYKGGETLTYVLLLMSKAVSNQTQLNPCS